MNRAIPNAAKQYRILVVLHKPFTEGAVVVVVQFRTPFEVPGLVVGGILVPVIHLRQIARIGDERLGDKTMYCRSFPAAVQ